MDFLSPDNLKIIIQLFMAVLLAGLLGFERQRAQKPAGLRTYALVGLGACILTIISVNAFDRFIGVASFDPSRIISNIIVGIGFIGAGLIFHQGIKVEGLTTATGIWVAAALGIAVGLEMYFLAAAGTIAAFILLGILKRLDIE